MDRDSRRDQRVKPPGIANMILPMALDGISPSAPQRRTAIKSIQEVGSERELEAIKLIGLGVLCLSVGVYLLYRSRSSAPPA